MKKLIFDKERYKKDLEKNKLTFRVSLFFSHLLMWIFFFLTSLLIGVSISIIVKEMNSHGLERIVNPGELKYILPMMSIYLIMYTITMLTGKTRYDFFGLKKNYFKIRKYFVAVILLFSILAFFTKKIKK